MKKNNLFILIVSVIIMLLLEGFYFGFLTDDPFITFRYAENFAHGRGLVFNPGEHVEGYSNFLFVLVMSAFSFLGVSGIGMLIAAKAVGIASSVGLLFLLYYAVKRFELNTTFAAGGVLFLLASNSLFATWMAGGLETGLFTLLLGACIVFRSRELEKSGIPFSSFFLGLLSITRPEGVLFFCTFFFISLFWRYKAGVSKKRLWFLATMDMLFFLSIAGTFELWRIAYYHDFVPNTFYVKTTGSLSNRLSAGVTYLVRVALATGMVIPFLFLKNARNNPLRLVSFGALSAGIFFILYAGGDWMPALRFFVPLLPSLYYLAAAKASDHLSWGADGKVRNALFYAVILFLNLPLTAYCIRTETAITREPPITNFYRHHEFPLWNSYSSAGYRIKNTTRDDAVIALGEAGVIPFVCNRKVIDLFGLNDRHIAQQQGVDQFSKQTDCDYILARADYVLLSQSRVENGKLVCQFRYAQDLLANQFFQKNFCLEWQESMFAMFRRCK